MSAKNAGCRGVVVDGAVIDARSLLKRDLPIFCRGTTLAHATNDQPGSVNVPVMLGGVPVHPGDLVLGDLDGVVVVPKAEIERIIVAAEEHANFLRGIAADLEAPSAPFST